MFLSVAPDKKDHELHLCGIFVGNVPVLVRAQLNVDPQSGCILKVSTDNAPWRSVDTNNEFMDYSKASLASATLTRHG